MRLEFSDWLIILTYLVITLVIGFWVSRKASEGTESYFLAGRSLPWWWAGTSIAATTFAADTPLAITGIIANDGLSGNWIWLSWIFLHISVAFIFARMWRKSEVITDAELVSLRYSGPQAQGLRLFKAGLYAIVFNCIILGWVLKAMTKVVQPFFTWDEWLPGLVGSLRSIWPADFVLGTPSEALTIFALLGLVAVYSTAGGIRGVILTDLLQLGIALIGSYWFAGIALGEVGGLAGLREGLDTLYGEEHKYLQLFPSSEEGWLAQVKLGFFGLGIYFLVQSYSSNPADGGGYLMQRLGACKDGSHARKAALWFVLLQYVIRIWPWFVVALAALVLIPIGQEETVYGGAVAFVGGDREAAYPALMGLLLRPGVTGVLLVGLLAAFMSTIDTHINWGASYIVNDFYRWLKPDASSKSQVRVARITVAFFAVFAVLVASQINTIGQAWEWIAALGAGLGIPTALRWFWWRINAWAEIGGSALGLAGAFFLFSATDLPFEVRLLVTALFGLAGTLLGVFFGPATDPMTLNTFVKKVDPIGFWGPHGDSARVNRFFSTVLRVAMMIAAVLFSIIAGHRTLLGEPGVALAAIAGALVLGTIAYRSQKDFIHS